MRRRALALLLLFVLLLGSAGCGADKGERTEISTRLLHPAGTVDPYAGLDSVRIRVTQGGALVGERTFSIAETWTVPADEADLLAALEVSVEGLAAGEVVRAGRSRAFVPGERTIGIFFAPPGRFSPAPSLPALPRLEAGVVELADARVLLVGGTTTTNGGAALGSTELYDPDTGTWSAGPPLLAPRIAPGIVRLADGRVLIAGGRDESGNAIDSTEILSADATGALSVAAGPALPRAWIRPAAVPFGTGALFAGGSGPDGPLPAIFDGTAWTELAGGVYAEGAALTLLTDGRAVIVGGASPDTLRRVDVASPAGVLTPGADVLRVARHGATAIPLDATRILVTGGADGATRLRPTAAAEIVDLSGTAPVSGFAPERDLFRRSFRAATRLADGRILLAGGYAEGATPALEATLRDPATGLQEETGALALPRAGRETVIALADGTSFWAGSDQVTAIDVYVPPVAVGTPPARADIAIEPRLTTRATGGVLDGAASWRLRFWDAMSLVDERTGTGAPGTISLPQFLVGRDPLHATIEVLDGNGVVIAWGATGHASSAASLATLLVSRVGEFCLSPDPLPSGHGYGVAAAMGGEVVVAGGAAGGLDVWSPSTGATRAANATVAHRRDARAARLDRHRVLITGGRSGTNTVLATASIVTAVSDTSFSLTATGSLGSTVEHHAIALLSSNDVFVHGRITGGLPVAFAQRWNGATWSNAGTPTARARHRATRLTDGRVLLAGGLISEGGAAVITTSAQIYVPSTNAYSATGPMATPRRDHEQIVLADGDVLACGGITTGDTQTALCERWDLQTGSWSAAGSLSEAKDDYIIVRRNDGMWMAIAGAIVAGETTTVDVIHPVTGAVSPGPPLQVGRGQPQADVLPDGRVVVVGGRTGTGAELDAVEVWTPPSWTNPFGG